MGVLADYLLVVSGSATTTYLCWLYRSLLLDKKCYFVCLLAVAFSTCYSVFALSLSFPHGVHLVVPTHAYFFWVACHPSKTFLSKEPEQEPHNRFFPSFHCQTMPSDP